MRARMQAAATTEYRNTFNVANSYSAPISTAKQNWAEFKLLIVIVHIATVMIDLLFFWSQYSSRWQTPVQTGEGQAFRIADVEDQPSPAPVKDTWSYSEYLADLQRHHKIKSR